MSANHHDTGAPHSGSHRLINSVLSRICKPALLENIEGDLEEIYHRDVAQLGNFRANILHFFRACGFIRPFAVKSIQTPDNPFRMWRNYFKIATRQFTKHKGTAFIHLSGLTLGIFCYLLILQYVSWEWSYDKFHDDGDRIYRVALNEYATGQFEDNTGAMNYYPVGEVMTSDLPEVESFTTIHNRGVVITHDNERYIEDKMFFVDSNFLEFFSYPLIYGEPETALKGRYATVISSRIAKKYFGSENPIGKVLQIQKTDKAIVQGVVDSKDNSHFQFDFLFNNEYYIDRRYRQRDEFWNWSNFWVYVKLAEGTDAEAVESKMPALMDTHYPEEEYVLEHILQPLHSLHLDSKMQYEIAEAGNARAVLALLAIAFIILLIAWVNYINLTTAQAAERAKEVGIRKVVGARRSQQIAQFMMQSGMLNILALVLAVALVIFAKPFFEQTLGRAFDQELFQQPRLLLLLVGFFVTGMLISGFYPAIVLSSFKPVSVLKGKILQTGKGMFLRKGLSVFQFASSILLIAATFAIYHQVKYMQSRDLGFNPEQTLVVDGPRIGDSTYTQKLQLFKNDMRQHPAVENITISSAVPGKEFSATLSGIRRQGVPEKEGHLVSFYWTDREFVPTFDMTMSAGRNFDETILEEEQVVLINQHARVTLGFENDEDAIAKNVVIGSEDIPDNHYRIMGVLKDYHHKSLKEKQHPIIILHDAGANDFYAIKLKSDEAGSVITSAKTAFEKHLPGNAFQYYFLDDQFNAQYKADIFFGRVLALFGGIAIFIACLGLFGLTAFTVIRKTKEIGIRKVLGASASSIMYTLSREFTLVLILAGLIALPLSYFLIKKWLENYAFHIEMQWFFFVVPLLLMVLIAFMTISFHTVRAARANPISSLRHE